MSGRRLIVDPKPSTIAVASLLTITGAEPVTRHSAHQRTHGAIDIRLYPGWPPHAVGVVVLVAEPAMAMRSWPVLPVTDPERKGRQQRRNGPTGRRPDGRC